MGLSEYESVAGRELIERIRTMGRQLAGLKVVHINSTLTGGGVAELLTSLVPLMRECGLDAAWRVLEAGPDFFTATKTVHNGLHGQQVHLTEEMKQAYMAVAARNRRLPENDAGFVILHDQQPLGLATFRDAHPGRWLWYCHIDPRPAVEPVWEFLRPLAAGCDAAIFHLPAYARNLPVLQYFMPPAIDPLADKNRAVSEVEYQNVLTRLGVNPVGPPVILQVSRFDRLKDPAGVIKAFLLVRHHRTCRLILAGGGASDDPEGTQVLAEMRRLAGGHPDITVMELTPDSNLEINVLQRRADVIVQKSIREGFGLTATEALWKGRPLVVTPTGGLAFQVQNGRTGLHAGSVEELAARIEQLLDNPALGQRLGTAGREYVRRRFILPVYLHNWLHLLLLLQKSNRPG